MMSRFRRITALLWEQRFKFPLTPLGTAALLAALWVERHWGESQKDFVLYSAAWVGLILMCTALVMVLLASLLLWLRLRRLGGLSDLELESGATAVTSFSFPRFSAWPLVQVRMEWAEPGRVAVWMERVRGRVQEVVQPEERGDFREIHRRFVVADIFGLCRLGLYVRRQRRVRIVPSRARISGHALTHFVGGEGISHPTGPAEGELLDMRRYGPGDPLRFVLWKAFARTRQLLVRTYERAVSPDPSAVAYFVAGRHDESSASAARVFLEDGMLGQDFLFLADGAKEATSKLDEAIDQIVCSVHARPSGASGLARFLERARQEGKKSVVLFLPAGEGPWLARVEAVAQQLTQATCVLAMEGSVEQRRAARLKRWLFSAAPGPRRASLKELRRVVRRLSKAGLRLEVLHHPSGERLAVSRVLGEATR